MKKGLLMSLALGAISLAASAATHNIYVANLTDWGNDVALYSWGDSEIFGGWPGATPMGQETINNVKYDVWTVEGHDGEVAHPILNNNNNGSQIDLPIITLDQANYYFATNGVVVNQYDDPANPNTSFEEVKEKEGYLYLLDKTGWDNLAVYGWASGKPEAFGGWPGATATETVTIAGETYYKVAFNGDGETAYNIIFSHDGGGDGNQFDMSEQLVAGNTYYVEVNPTSATILPTPGVETYNIYIEDNTGWDALYLYAYYNDVPSIFGAWPGVAVTETATVDGKTYKVVKDVEATENAQIFIANNGAGDQINIEGEYPINKAIYLTLGTPAAAVSIVDADNVEAEYYTLQGVRMVSEPANGIYIVRKGSKVLKVVK